MLFWLTLRQTRKILLSGSASGWLTVNPDADQENKHESFVKCPEVAVSQKKVKKILTAFPWNGAEVITGDASKAP